MRKPLIVLAVLCLIPTWASDSARTVPRVAHITGPVEGKARVYVFHFGQRPYYAGPTGKEHFEAQLFDGHSYVGSVEPGRYYGFDLDPGTHLLWSKTAREQWFLRATVETGRTYYVHLLLLRPLGMDTPVGPPRPSLINAGADHKRGKKSLKKIKKLLAIDPLYVYTGELCVFQEPATAEHLEAMQEKLGPMIEKVMATWDETWTNEPRWDVLHESDYVK